MDLRISEDVFSSQCTLFESSLFEVGKEFESLSKSMPLFRGFRVWELNGGLEGVDWCDRMLFKD